jgi:hypothetical protein
MVHSVLLFEPDTGKEIPHWWRNFGKLAGEDIDGINDQLLEYSAHFVCMVERKENGPRRFGRRYIDFYDEQAYFWFVLRWS